jgi:hypothetical protein
MAKSPRQSGRSVGLTPKTAKRIQRAVLKVERGGKDMQRPHLRTAGSDTEIQRGTFTAPWTKGNTATVTDATLTSVTYTAKNYFANLTGSGTKACAIAYVGGEWILIAAECP